MSKIHLIIPAIALFLSACSSEDPQLDPTPEIPAVPAEILEEAMQYSLTESETFVASQLGEFNLNFFRGVVASSGDDNIVCSPVSASLLLSMLANVADAQLRDEIVNTLGCDDIATMNSLARKTLVDLPNADPGATINFANGLWYHNAYTLNPAYEAVAAEYFATETFGMDFSQGTPVIKAVNEWVNKKTNKLIPQILTQLPAASVAILANAMYFKGAWTNPFKVEQTDAMPFNGKSGTSEVRMMHMLDLQYIYLTDYCTAIKLQIGNGSTEAIFAMPTDKYMDIDDFIESGLLYTVWKSQYVREKVDLSLPRFKYEPKSSLQLTDILEDLGITSLSRSTELGIFTQSVTARHDINQKATIEFTEQGAEGAAVTTLGPCGSFPMGPPPIPIVNFNRPFVFMILDAVTGNMLFAGKIATL